MRSFYPKRRAGASVRAFGGLGHDLARELRALGMQRRYELFEDQVERRARLRPG